MGRLHNETYRNTYIHMYTKVAGSLTQTQVHLPNLGLYQYRDGLGLTDPPPPCKSGSEVTGGGACSNFYLWL